MARDRVVDQGTLEAEADRLLAEHSFELHDVRLFTQRRLERKIRNELRRLPHAGQETLPAVVCEYILERHIRLLLEGIDLSGLQRSTYALYVWGLRPSEIAGRLGVSPRRAARAIVAAGRAIGAGRFRYAGLYEVYWSEVHRCVYRKPRRPG